MKAAGNAAPGTQWTRGGSSIWLPNGGGTWAVLRLRISQGQLRANASSSYGMGGDHMP